jgi:general secretion pathway protein M
MNARPTSSDGPAFVAAGWLSRVPAWSAGAARWRALAPRERALVATAAGLLLAVLLWAVGIQPAWRTLQRAPAQLDELDGQTLTMRRLAAEVRELRQTPPPSAVQASAALQAATQRLGPGARLTVQADRAVLTLEGVPPQAFRAWLAEARSGARARPLEVQLMQAGAGFSGTVTVAIPVTP